LICRCFPTKESAKKNSITILAYFAFLWQKKAKIDKKIEKIGKIQTVQ